MKNILTVADFFCGAGGFSEGFRQAGFKIVFAMDNWEPARSTHNINHPDCSQPSDGDILNISVDKINQTIPDVDVIIGSPPCVNFSHSNRAGKADKTEGIELIKKFLQIIAIKKNMPKSKLKYWLMENVPNSRKYIKTRYTFKELGIKNKDLNRLRIPKREKDIAIELDNSETKIYNSVYYAIPQKRNRFITGEFPEPKKITPSEKNWISLGKVLNAFRIKNGEITDPLYGFKIKQDALTDHFYDAEIPKMEWEEAKIKKQQARYYGKMSFPENESRPARTVMATRSIIAREAMIFSNGKPGVYRAPTIREIASIMSFPITYLFSGIDEATKYKLIGNAVCPRLAYCFATAILKELKIRKKYRYKSKAIKSNSFLDLRINPPPKKKPRPKNMLSNFCEIIPDLKMSNFRVELDNNFPKDNCDRIIWRASIHHATGKEHMKKSLPSLQKIKTFLDTYQDKRRINAYIQEIKRTFNKNIPKTKRFQEQHCLLNNDNEFFTPRETLKKIKKILDRQFPRHKYDSVSLSNLAKNNKEYISFDNGEIPDNRIPLRIVAGLYAVKYVSMLTKGMRK